MHAKVSWKGTQLEVARGKEFCKAGRRIKNADVFTKALAGAGKRADWGFLGTGNSGFAATLVVVPAPHFGRRPHVEQVPLQRRKGR
jgi:hypothetical protein